MFNGACISLFEPDGIFRHMLGYSVTGLWRWTETLVWDKNTFSSFARSAAAGQRCPVHICQPSSFNLRYDNMRVWGSSGAASADRNALLATLAYTSCCRFESHARTAMNLHTPATSCKGGWEQVDPNCLFWSNILCRTKTVHKCMQTWRPESDGFRCKWSSEM